MSEQQNNPTLDQQNSIKNDHKVVDYISQNHQQAPKQQSNLEEAGNIKETNQTTQKDSHHEQKVQNTQQKSQQIEKTNENGSPSPRKLTTPILQQIAVPVPPTPQDLLLRQKQMIEKQKLINDILKMYDDFERLQLRSEQLQQQNQYFTDKILQFEAVIYEDIDTPVDE